mmetsp:Transcript_25501/g.55725  ORF Transcript_25501/g.55725 Transcript_25501/m.55725 type:complete len:195 (+) Transcript_25501:1047-1631(+)
MRHFAVSSLKLGKLTQSASTPFKVRMHQLRSISDSDEVPPYRITYRVITSDTFDSRDYRAQSIKSVEKALSLYCQGKDRISLLPRPLREKRTRTMKRRRCLVFSERREHLDVDTAAAETHHTRAKGTISPIEDRIAPSAMARRYGAKAVRRQCRAIRKMAARVRSYSRSAQQQRRSPVTNASDREVPVWNGDEG